MGVHHESRRHEKAVSAVRGGLHAFRGLGDAPHGVVLLARRVHGPSERASGITTERDSRCGRRRSSWRTVKCRTCV